MTYLMPKMPNERAVLFVEFIFGLAQLHRVGFFDIEGNEAVIMTGKYFFVFLWSQKLKSEACIFAVDGIDKIKSEFRQTVEYSVFGHFNVFPFL